MKRFVIALFGLASLVSAKPVLLSIPYATLTSGRQVPSASSATLDYPEVAVARTRRAIAPLDERVNLASEAEHSALPRVRSSRQSSLHIDNGADGGMVDTAEVAAARAAHAAAHANEAARSGGTINPLEAINRAIDTSKIIDPNNGGILDALQAATSKAVNDGLDLVNEAAKSGDSLVRAANDAVPLNLGSGVVILVPVDPDGRSPNVPGVMVRSLNPTNNVRSVDALAIADSALAYGRLVY